MVFLAFVSLGFLVGSLIGMSAESTVTVVLPLLFAFGGGSAVAFLHKLSDRDARRAAMAVVALSLSCLVGVLGGVVVTERQLLTPSDLRKARREASPTVESLKVLRSEALDSLADADAQKRAKIITCDQAYDRVYRLAAQQGHQ